MLVQFPCFDSNFFDNDYTNWRVDHRPNTELFPDLNEDAKKQFPLEKKLLNRVWDSCIKRLKNYTSDVVEERKYPIDPLLEVALHGKLYSLGGCLLNGLVSMNVYRASGPGHFPLAILEAAEMHKLKLEKIADEMTIKKIRRCVKWLNLLTKFSEIFVSVEKGPTRERFSGLFEVFDRIQRKESKLTAQKVNEIEKLFLMDNLCKMVKYSWCDLVNDWKEKVDGDLSKELNFSPLDLSQDDYRHFFEQRKFRDNMHSEKILAAKQYIADEFLVR